MEIIEKNLISNNLFYEAKRFSIFRQDVKDYLKKFDKDFDKFTITQHDSYLGYFTEQVLKEYISSTFDLKNYKLETWADNFDLNKIKDIVYNCKTNVENVKYVQSYFYDKYDLKLSNNIKEIKIDIKTAETTKTPTNHWNFLYPVVQANQKNKDLIILCYYVKNTSNLNDLKNIVIAGYMFENDICNYEIIHANQYTIRHTKSQIDNYNTQLIDYKDIKTIENLL